jgi:hypothetical protein
MLRPTAQRRVLCMSMLAAAALAVSLTGLSLAAGARAAGETPVGRLAYVTQTLRSNPEVWLASATGSEAKALGPGQQPLLAPNGQLVAAGLFGTNGDSEHGPAIAVYAATGAPVANYLDLETATATPLAWSPDSRYLAVARQSTSVNNIAAGSGLDVIDTQSGTVTSIAEGMVYGASFARDGSDRIVFGLAHSLSSHAATNLYVANADGSGMRRLSSDGRSLFPVWGPSYIAYDRERPRKEGPVFQIWLASPSTAPVRRVTSIRVPILAQGLVPLAFSASGSRLLAEFEGEDQSSAYTVNVSSGRARMVRVRGRSAIGAGLSSDGSTLLIDENALEEPSSNGRVVAIPFGGGAATVLVAHGAQASWNR